MNKCCLYRVDGGGTAGYGQHPMADTERAELIPEPAASSSSSSVARTQRHKKAWRWLDIHIDRRIFSAAAVVSQAQLHLPQQLLQVSATVLAPLFSTHYQSSICHGPHSQVVFNV